MQGQVTEEHVDVVVIGDDRLRVDVLVAAIAERSSLRVLGRVAGVDELELQADVAVTDIADAAIAVALPDVASRWIALDGSSARTGPLDSAEVELLATDTTLDAAVRAIEGRGPTLPTARLGDGREQPDQPDRLATLTGRELEVLEQLLIGDDSVGIGGRLGISEHTVRTHVQNLLPKLGVSSRADAAMLAMDLGIEAPVVVDAS